VRNWWAAQGEAVRVPVSILAEVTYLIGSRLGPHLEERFVRDIANGEFLLEELELADYARAADLMAAYADLGLGFVDASIVAMAERLDITTILTTDRRHFGVVRPAHCERLRLVP
jgi:predicted nucleic acid-binding protein